MNRGILKYQSIANIVSRSKHRTNILANISDSVKNKLKPVAGILILLPVFLFLANWVLAQTPAKVPPTTRILFILDASGSMYDNMDGTKTRILVAKDILSNLVDSLKNQPRLEIGLRVFGHQFDRKYNNCTDTKLEVPFKPGNHADIKTKIKAIDPKGTTLIAHSILQAAEDFPQGPNSRNILILITDGIEACGGDPCAISIALQKKGIFLKPFIIGLGSNANFDKAFSCMGQYYDANDSKTFKAVLDKVMKQTFEKTTVKVELLNEQNQPKETNVNVSFVNNVTNQIVYDFVHFLAADGKTDVLDIDPVLSYDLVVNTIPQVVKKDVYLEGGTENVIRIKCPQGILFLKSNYQEYKNLKMIIRDQQGKTLNVQNQNSFDKYLTGTYSVEILTLPRTYFPQVKIEQGKTTTLQIDAPGVLSVVNNISGFGSIYKIHNSGHQEWVANLENENSRTSLGMQPGNYKLVFRSKNASGSRFTEVKEFTIRSGATTNVKLF